MGTGGHRNPISAPACGPCGVGEGRSWGIQSREVAGLREVADKAATNAMTEQIRQTALAAKLYDDKQRKRGAAVLSGLAHASIARAAIEYDGPIVLSKREADEIKNDGKLND